MSPGACWFWMEKRGQGAEAAPIPSLFAQCSSQYHCSCAASVSEAAGSSSQGSSTLPEPASWSSRGASTYWAVQPLWEVEGPLSPKLLRLGSSSLNLFSLQPEGQ